MNAVPMNAYETGGGGWFQPAYGYDPQAGVKAAAAMRTADMAAIDADIEAGAEEEKAARNEATAMRQNQAATMGRMGTRAGGGRYRRRGLFNVPTGGLAAANSQALVGARKKRAYTAYDANQLRTAQAAYANRPQGFINGALYL